MNIDLKNAEEVKELLKAIEKHKKDTPKAILSAAKAIKGNKASKGIDSGRLRVEYSKQGENESLSIQVK